MKTFTIYVTDTVLIQVKGIRVDMLGGLLSVISAESGDTKEIKFQATTWLCWTEEPAE